MLFNAQSTAKVISGRHRDRETERDRERDTETETETETERRYEVVLLLGLCP